MLQMSFLKILETKKPDEKIVIILLEDLLSDNHADDLIGYVHLGIAELNSATLKTS